MRHAATRKRDAFHARDGRMQGISRSAGCGCCPALQGRRPAIEARRPRLRIRNHVIEALTDAANAALRARLIRLASPARQALWLLEACGEIAVRGQRGMRRGYQDRGRWLRRVARAQNHQHRKPHGRDADQRNQTIHRFHGLPGTFVEPPAYGFIGATGTPRGPDAGQKKPPLGTRQPRIGGGGGPGCVWASP